MFVRVVVMAVLLVLAGCATPVGVDPVDPRELRPELNRSVLTGREPSARSIQLLDRLALTQVWREEPAIALEAIRSGLGGPDTTERLLGLAELSFAAGERTGDTAWYRAACVAAWAYLFPDHGHPGPNPFDPGLRLAADLYNRGLARGFSSGRADLSHVQNDWTLPYGTLEVSLDGARLDWSGYALRETVPSDEFRVRGLRNRYRRVGIGTPLSATVERVEGEAQGHRVGDNVRVPITALLRFDDAMEGLRTGSAAARLEVYVMDRQSEVEIAGRRVPLEYEPSVALATSLEDSRIWEFEFAGFFSGSFTPFGDLADGLILMHPYRPGRIPVVLVHGTASSPARWAELVNELLGDPALADRIQIWLFLYNTGNPVLFSGSRLREALRATVSDLDPSGQDPALGQMVVAGHSQGGLLTKLQAVSPGTTFWDQIADRPLAELDISQESRELLEDVMFFDALPFVRRVVYIATPHGGSYQATRRIAGWIGGLITLPLDLTRRMAEILTRNDQLRLGRRIGRLPTSLDNMRPGNPFLEGLASLREAPWVSVSSIVAVKGAGPPDDLSDGVVAYRSAHLGYGSERVIRSGHSVQGHPGAIAELKRILFEHLEQASPLLAEPAS